jgi:Protein of unknown function (DUF3122)
MSNPFYEKFMIFKKTIQTILLGFAICFCLLVGVGQNPTRAAIRQLEEAPGQMVYQSRQTLKDRHGNNWKAIAFKRIRANDKTNFYLRLVGFPGVTKIDRSQPLTLTNSLGKTLTATEASGDIFTESASPEPSVGQYDLQPLLPQLQVEIPLKLSLPTIGGESISLSVPPSFVEEWQTVSSYK